MAKRKSAITRPQSGTQPAPTVPSGLLEHSSPAKLAGLMNLQSNQTDWPAEDLAAILLHQLKQPLDPIVEIYLPACGSNESSASAQKRKIKTFDDLFHASSPPPELLDIVRQYAKSCHNEKECSLPPVIAGALYWSVMAVSIATKTKIQTKLTHTDIQVGLKWLADQKWMTPFLQQLAQKAMEKCRILKAEC